MTEVNDVLERLDLYEDVRREMEELGVRPSFWWRRLSLRQDGRTFYLSFRVQDGIGVLEMRRQGERFVAEDFSVRS